MSATDRPWAWHQYGEKTNAFVVGAGIDEEGKPLEGRIDGEKEFVVDPVCELEGSTVNYDDAELIVRAVNAHDELVAATKEMRDAIAPHWHLSEHTKESKKCACGCCRILGRVDAALEVATKGGEA